MGLLHVLDSESAFESEPSVEYLQHSLQVMRTARNREADGLESLFQEMDAHLGHSQLSEERESEPVPGSPKEIHKAIRIVQAERQQILERTKELSKGLDALADMNVKFSI